MPDKSLFKLLLLIAPINALANVTVNYFPPGTLNPGTIRAIFIIVFVALFLKKGFLINKLNVFVVLSLFYWGILSVFSSSPSSSLYLYVRLALSLLMIPVGYYIIDSIPKFKLLNLSYIVAMFAIIADISLANVFGYGTSDYIAETFYYGSGRVNITKPLIILVFTAPVALFLTQRKHRYWLIFLFSLGLIYSLVGIKRSVLLSAISGSILYLLLSPFRMKIIKSAGLIYILLITVFSFFLDTFFVRLDARGERVFVTEESIDEEARFNEYNEVLKSWKTGSLKHKLIGSEFLNDRDLFRTDRMLHTDYMIILSGSGIIGITLWLLLFYMIIQKKSVYYIHLKRDVFFRELNAVFWVIIVAQLIMSISGTIYDLTLRSFVFLYLGSILGLMKGQAIAIYSVEETGNSIATK